MILAIDTSTAACSVALIGAEGIAVSAAHEVIGRGHAERLVPMVGDVIGHHVPSAILVGTGPGSFTGLRVGIAAAQGLSIGWQVPVQGMNSLCLLAAEMVGARKIAAVMKGGHGDLFVQQFCGRELTEDAPFQALPPADAARVIDASCVIGPGARALVDERGTGEVHTLYPNAANAMRLPQSCRTLDVRPVYGRAPDATPSVAA